MMGKMMSICITCIYIELIMRPPQWLHMNGLYGESHCPFCRLHAGCQVGWLLGSLQNLKLANECNLHHVNIVDNYFSIFVGSPKVVGYWFCFCSCFFSLCQKKCETIFIIFTVDFVGWIHKHECV